MGRPDQPAVGGRLRAALDLAYRAAKAADPSVTVITAGLSPTGWDDDTARPDDDYLRWLYRAGLKGGVNYDVLGAHGNTQCPSVEASFGNCPVQPERMRHPSFYFRRIEQLRQIMAAAGDANQQVWLLEFGWTTDTVNPSYSWYATTEQTKAELIVDAFQYASAHWSPWIGVMIVWTLADPRWIDGDEQVSWAITNRDGSPRLAYDRLLQASRQGELPRLATPGLTSRRSPPRAARRPCATLPQGGELLVVTGASSELVSLRTAPSRDADVLEKLADGATLQPRGAAQDADGLTWYPVRGPGGEEGWVTSEFVRPASLEQSSTTPESPASP